MDYDTASPATEAPPGNYRERSCPPEYVKTRQGILKIIQMVVSLLTFILSVAGGWGSVGGGWGGFVGITGLINSTIWFTLHMLSVIPDIMANYFIEVIVYCFLTLFFFIAGVVAACQGSVYPVAGAAAFFAFVGMIVFGADATIQLLEIRTLWKARNDRRQVPTKSADEDDIFIRRPNAAV
jgi:hypothetical protein